MSNGPYFFRTRMGAKFYESDVPRIAKALEDIVLHLGKTAETRVCGPATGGQPDGFKEWAEGHRAKYGDPIDAVDAYRAGAQSMEPAFGSPEFEAKTKHPNPMHPDNDAHDGTDALCLATYGRMPCARDYLGGSEAKMLYDAAQLLEAYKGDVKEAAGELMVELPEPGSDASKMLSANSILRRRIAKVENQAPSDKERELLANLVDAEILRIRDEPSEFGTEAKLAELAHQLRKPE